jgi:hypothetical protein
MVVIDNASISCLLPATPFFSVDIIDLFEGPERSLLGEVRPYRVDPLIVTEVAQCSGDPIGLLFASY